MSTKKKELFALLVTIVLITITYGAFYLPDYAMYVHKSTPHQYTTLMNVWATIGVSIMCVASSVAYWLFGCWLYEYFTN